MELKRLNLRAAVQISSEQLKLLNISFLTVVHDHYSLRSEGVICCCTSVIRRRSRKQNSFAAHSISSPRVFLFCFVFLQHNCPWEKWVTLPACVFLYVSLRLCVKAWTLQRYFEFIFGRTGRKRQRNKSQSAQSDRNPILLGEKVNVNTAWCKFTDWISCKLFFF